jgi:membrane protease YdiL (CAAX protease family)
LAADHSLVQFLYLFLCGLAVEGGQAAAEIKSDASHGGAPALLPSYYGSKAMAEGENLVIKGRSSITPREWLRFSALLYAVAVVVSVLWRRGVRDASIFFASEESAQEGINWLSDGGVGLFAGLLMVFLSRELMGRLEAGKALGRTLAEALGSLSLLHTTLLALFSSIGEEFFFRGALQPEVGLVAASLLFGLAHFMPRREFLFWTLFACAAGLLLGALYMGTGNLLAPIVAHFTVNVLNLPYLVRKYAGGAPLQ